MAGSIYLQPAEYAQFNAQGLTPPQVQQASTMLDGFLDRPEGLAWTADAAGNPCYMTALDPYLSLQLAAPIVAGPLVSVQLAVNVVGFTQDQVGEVVVIDRSTPSRREACVIAAVSGTPATGVVLTLANVAYAHPSGAGLDFGLVLTEERSLPAKRSIARVAKWPVARLLSCQGRYGYGRRQQQAEGQSDAMNLLIVQGVMGGAPIWQPVEVANTSVNRETGEIWIPAGTWMAYFTEVRLKFVAGWNENSIPPDVKQAVAILGLALANTDPVMMANLKSYAAGGTKIERFSNGLIDDSVVKLVRAYRTRSFF